LKDLNGIIDWEKYLFYFSIVISTHIHVGRDVTTLPIGSWEEMWQLYHRPVGRDVETLPTGLWVDFPHLFPQVCG